MAQYFVKFCWAILAGLIIAQRYWFVSDTNALFWIVSVGLLLFIVSIYININWLKVFAILILGFAIGFWRFNSSVQMNEYQEIFSQQVEMYGKVISHPEINSNGNQILVIQPDNFSQYIRVSLFNSAAVEKGDEIKFSGVVNQPENFNNFNYIQFLAKDNIYAELKKSQIIPLQRDNNFLQSIFIVTKQYIIHSIKKQLPEDQAGIVLGMLVGDKTLLSKDLQNSFQRTGLTHILVVSGFNLTILASSLGILAWILGRKFTDVFSLGLVWCFVLLVGSGSSVVRAGIMVSLFLLARMVGRLSYSYITLLLAVVVMSLLNPLQFFYDIGFQLSVAATLGVLQSYQLRIIFGKEGWLSEILWTSLSAIIFTLPIVALYFQTVSLTALPANMIIVPTIPIIMLLGALSLLPKINFMIAPVLELLLSFDIKIVNLISAWKYSVVSWQITLPIVICYYFLLFIIFNLVLNRQQIDLKNNLNHDRMTKIKL